MSAECIGFQRITRRLRAAVASLVRRTSVPLAVCALTTSGYGQYQYNNVPAMPSVPNAMSKALSMTAS